MRQRHAIHIACPPSDRRLLPLLRFCAGLLKRLLVFTLYYVLSILLSFAAAPVRAAAATIKPGDLLWSIDFHAPAAQQNSTGAGTLAAEAGHGTVLEVANTTAAHSATRDWSLPIDKLRGRLVSIVADVRADGISAKPHPSNGVKVMLRTDTPSGTQWPQPQIGVGTFDWTHLSELIRISEDATAATLVLGLENVTGTAHFDHVHITFIRDMTPAPPAPPDQPIFRGSFGGNDLPRLRGAMIQPNTLSEADLRTFALDWGGNLVRWQLVRSNGPAEEKTPAAYDRWLDGQLQKLDQGLAWAKAMGVMVVVDLHSPPGAKNSPDRPVRSARLGLELPRLPRMVRLERGVWSRQKQHSAGRPAHASEGTVAEVVQAEPTCQSTGQLARILTSNSPQSHQTAASPHPSSLDSSSIATCNTGRGSARDKPDSAVARRRACQ